MPSTKYKSNFKKAISKSEVNNTLWGILATGTYLVVPSILKRVTNGAVDGWSAFAVGSITTWLTGALFDIPAFRYVAIGVSAIHIVYSKFANTMTSLGIPLWRMGGDLAFSQDAPNVALPEGGVSDYIQYDNPNAFGYTARPAYELQSMNDYVDINNIGMNDYINLNNSSLNDYSLIGNVPTRNGNTDWDQETLNNNAFNPNFWQ